MSNIETIKTHPVYQQILKDSFGGIMYNVANRGKYDSAEILRLWTEATPGERSAADGIMAGAFGFLAEKEY
jgi:hypothetical protein